MLAPGRLHLKVRGKETLWHQPRAGDRDPLPRPFTPVLYSAAREGGTEERGRKGYYGECGTWLRLGDFPFSSKNLPHCSCPQGLVSQTALGTPLAAPASARGAVRDTAGVPAVPTQLRRVLGPSRATPAPCSHPQGSGWAAGTRRCPLCPPAARMAQGAQGGTWQAIRTDTVRKKSFTAYPSQATASKDLRLLPEPDRSLKSPRKTEPRTQPGLHFSIRKE